MSAALFYLLMQAASSANADAWRRIADSGRVVEQGESESKRVAPKPALAPGPPPLLQFRYLEGKLRHRFGDNALVLDDAGH